ncbi:zinc-binding dehydrogenase [Streptomyces sp. NPDC001100]
MRPAAHAETVRGLGATAIDCATTEVEEYVAAHIGGEGFDIVFDTVGGTVLDNSFAAVRTYTGHVRSALGRGSHSLAPPSFRGATYSGVLTLLPMLTGNGREHHGEILREAAALADAGRRSARRRRPQRVLLVVPTPQSRRPGVPAVRPAPGTRLLARRRSEPRRAAGRPSPAGHGRVGPGPPDLRAPAGPLRLP